MQNQTTETKNNPNQQPDKIEDSDKQSLDEFSAEESSNPITDTKTNFTNQTINHLKATLRGLYTRQLPAWDHNKKKRDSIKDHLHRAKELGRRMQWSDEELAQEVMFSLRGETGNIARQFPDKIQSNFKLLEKELEKYFWVPKPKSQMMKEFNNLAWNEDKQMLQQYGITLRSKLSKIFKPNTEEFDLKLRDRFIEGIKESRPEFGRSFEMLDLDDKTDFMELATYAQSKYDVYRNNTEQIEETQAFLSQEFSNEKFKNEYKESKSYDMHDDSRPNGHIIDHKDYYEDNYLGFGFQNDYNTNLEIFPDDENDYQECYDNELDIPYANHHEPVYQDQSDDFEEQSFDLYQNNYSGEQQDFNNVDLAYYPEEFEENNPYANNDDKFNALNDELNDWYYQHTDFAEYENNVKHKFYDKYDNGSEHKYYSDNEDFENDENHQSKYDNFDNRNTNDQSLDGSLISEDFYQGNEIF